MLYKETNLYVFIDCGDLGSSKVLILCIGVDLNFDILEII